ncbi:MAG: hypothetical protein LBG67_01375 [Campylobacteraceae bacterium]|jgi:uncharacterized membrane protein|nr:hypothetical protein [Campylobacteraceae bacterium]
MKTGKKWLIIFASCFAVFLIYSILTGSGSFVGSLIGGTIFGVIIGGITSFVALGISTILSAINKDIFSQVASLIIVGVLCSIGVLYLYIAMQ